MVPMKFYRDFKSIFFANIVWVDTLGITLPILIFAWIRSPQQLLELTWFNGIVVAFLLFIWFIAFRALYKILYNLKDLLKVTLEIDKEGIRYPYLLSSPDIIPWAKIQDIQYKEVQTDKVKHSYILLDFAVDYSLPILSSVPDSAELEKVRKASQRNILIITQDILRSYDLEDIANNLIARWQKATQIGADSLSEKTIIYRKHGRPLSQAITRSLWAILACGVLLYNMGVMVLWAEWRNSMGFQHFFDDFYTHPLLLLLTLLAFLYIVGSTMLPAMLDILRAQTALQWDKKGLLVVNDQELSPFLTWNKVGDMRIEYHRHKNYRAKRQPMLVIESKANILGETQKFVIKRELEDTNMHNAWRELYAYWNHAKQPF